MNINKIAEQSQIAIIGAIALALSACVSPLGQCLSSSPLATRGPEQVFSTPEQAADALAAANRRGDKDALLKILGPEGSRIINSGDPVADKRHRERFVFAYDNAHELERDDDAKATLIVGQEEWPLPIPLVHVGDKEKGSAGWQFDTKAGVQEILNRRIGRNELNVIDVCRAYVEAQREYALGHHDFSGRVKYAQRFISTKGRHDGLYWPVQAGQKESPLGPLVANAQAEGYAAGEKHKRQPYHGYYYRILRGQGAHAAGGAKDYMENLHMLNGFALIAFPAKYGDSGIMTFIVNQDGFIFEKNLGPETEKIANRITKYDPDKSWKSAVER
jgi:hypothetical protein